MVIIKKMIDITDWIRIPPPDFVISTSPSNLVFMPGDEKVVEVVVKSVTGFEPFIHLYSPNEDGIQLNFEGGLLRIPPYGIDSKPLYIKVPENTEPRHYTIPIFANGTFPPETYFVPKNPNKKIDFKIPGVESQNITKQSTISLVVKEPLTPYEKITNFWSDWGGLVQFVIGLLIGGGIIKFVPKEIRILKNKHNDST